MKIALLISGNGTTAEQIILAARSGILKNIEPALIIGSRAGAPGIGRAMEAGISKDNVVVIQLGNFENEETFGEAIIKACEARGVEFIGQYGWMQKTPQNVIERFQGMMVNQHPGPLDTGRLDFGGTGMYGRRVHAARLFFVRRTNRDFWTEATAHRVTANFDEGAVVKRKQVPILPDDDAETLRERVLPAEHEVQIETLRDFATWQVKELKRETPLVLPGEEKILDECKAEAIKLYPHG
ncbi:MAG: hypothetical protein HY433_02175 [Candidatus Liptonbacteria bacterium]|nr:hypothetical protein [Candidatus Liptonbacteria bacterium]